MSRLLRRRNLEDILQNLPVRSLVTHQDRQTLCDTIGYWTAPDLRFTLWDVTVSPGDPFQVEGSVSIATSLKALEAAAEKLGKPCDISRVRSLPCLDDDSKRFGLIVRSGRSLLADKEGSERFETMLYGESVRLLRREDSRVCVQTQSGYIGWIQKDDFRAIDEPQWLDWVKYDRTLVTESIEWYGVVIPAGSELPITPERNVLLPNGFSLPYKPGIMSICHPDRKNQTGILVKTAKSLIGVSYLWGGTNGEGIDCSGFTRYVYKHIGIQLPRDADQQFLVGTTCALPNLTGSLRLGDLLFFMGDNGGIVHVGMALSDREFIHASSNTGVTVTTFTDEQYLREHLYIGKRII